MLQGEGVDRGQDISVLAQCSPTELTSAPGLGTQEGLPSCPGELGLFQGKITPRDNASKDVQGQAVLIREWCVQGSDCAQWGLGHLVMEVEQWGFQGLPLHSPPGLHGEH